MWYNIILLATVTLVCGISKIKIPSMSVTNVQSGRPAFLTAINELNKNRKILPDYLMELISIESILDEDYKDLTNVQKIVDYYKQCSADDNSYMSPLVLGPTWSGSSMWVSLALNTVNISHITGSATSTFLSNKKKHKNIFRTISSDVLQAKAVIELLNHFGIERIGYVYLSGIQSKLKDIIKNYDERKITVLDTNYYANDHISIQNVAKDLKKYQVYTIVLYIRGDHIRELFQELRNNNLTQPQYHYIFLDVSWIEESTIKYFNLSKYINTYWTIVPAYPAMFSEEMYELIHTNGATYHPKSLQIHKLAQKNRRYLNATELDFNMEIITNYFHFVYDSVYAIAYALHEYIYNLNGSLTNCGVTQETQQTLINILVDKVNFVGASGNVSFDTNGDRVYGTFAYGYIDNGSVKYFGGITDDNVYINDSMSKQIFPAKRKTDPQIKMTENSRRPMDGLYQTILLYFVCPILLLFLIFIAYKWFKDKPSTFVRVENDEDDEDNVLDEFADAIDHIGSEDHDMTST